MYRPMTLPAGTGTMHMSLALCVLTPAFERATLDAVAAAHRETGAPVMVHLEFCTAAHEVLDLLAEQGVAADRVVLAHADRDPDPGLHAALAARGAYLGYDGFARPRTRSDAELLTLTEAVVHAGAGERIVLGGVLGALLAVPVTAVLVATAAALLEAGVGRRDETVVAPGDDGGSGA